MRVLRRARGVFVDYPSVVSWAILAAVIAHLLLAQHFPKMNIAAALADSKLLDPEFVLMSLSLGVAGVSAMVGGFAGVVVVFGLGSENDRFRLLRRRGGRRLRANWISVVLSSFAAAFGAVISAAVVVAVGPEPGMWLLEACLLFAAHGALRLTALLAGLAGIVDQEDADAARGRATAPTVSVIPNKSQGK